MTVGIDVVEVRRIARLLERHANARRRLFSDDEIAYCDGRRQAPQHFAVRWAAKEAVFKALGCGLRDGVGWRDVEVVLDPGGRPSVRLRGKTNAMAERQGMQSIEISLSHSGDIAIAQAVAVLAEPSAQ